MRKIKWGVLGTAYIFERDTAEGMRQAENCELYAIAGRSLEKAEAFQKKYGFQKAYGSYEALLADPEVEAVYLPLPNNMHREWAIRAMQAGKHVLCEKPLAPTEEEAAQMFAAAKENGVKLMEAFAYLHSPFVEAISKEIENGVIGEIRYAEAALITSDYNSANIRMCRDTFGGSLYDIGVYSSSMLLRMLGQEPESVHAVSIFSQEKVDLFTMVLMEFPGGARAQFNSGMVLATERNSAIDRFQIHGTLGSIQAIDFGFNVPGRLSYRLKTFDGIDMVKYVESKNNYRLEVEQFGRCITDGESPLVSEELTMSVARTIDRILKEIHY